MTESLVSRIARFGERQEWATVTVTVAVVVKLPVSETFTQYVPAASFAESCALPPATAPEVEFVTAHVPPLDGPTPSVNGAVVAGDTVVSVMPTFPAVVTVNVKMSELFGASEPLKVSVVEVDVLVDGELELSNGLQATVIDTRASSDQIRSRR